MRTSLGLHILGATLAGRVLADDAPPSTDNPAGVVYQAILPKEPFFAGAAIEGNVKGSIMAVAEDDGNGVMFSIMFENLPAEGGPFTYHIHTDRVVDNNCTVTKTHLDPYNAGVAVPCDPSNPQSCEVGDLAGKHGKVGSDPYMMNYTDLYASTNESSMSFFGNRSFVLHYANSTRITCANFELKMMEMPGNCNSTKTPAPMHR
ncbi:superoxide dismutase [Stachybotrys elegans]|uniref:superoxide dismutase n=1 Tax=Stachybotrys elegans TaxID=80388 RepID=A0A8K0WKV3_9HYPO|nr:superoxide dismutase [Stachybotrys elegans]